jgi:glycosyltransferase involved in cell wall biosynthesis
MRVLFVASSGEPGGAELALLTYLEHMGEAVEPHGLVLSPGPVAAAMAERIGRPVAVASVSGRPTASEAARFGRGLTGALRRLRPDVVLATGVKAAMLCALPCRLAGVPLAWHKVDFSWDDRLARPLAMLCAGVIGVSAEVAAAVPAARRLPEVPPPVRLAPGFRVSAQRPAATIGSVGRLVPYKGHADVIAAAGRLGDARVVIAGGADPAAPGHADELRAAARRHGVETELLGHVEEIEAVYERLTVLVQATYRDERGFGREGFGAAAAEASWAGLPVVATGGPFAGRRVPERDPAAIAAAVAAYLADPARAHADGEAGARRAREQLAPAPLAAALVSALREVAARAAAPAASAPRPGRR